MTDNRPTPDLTPEELNRIEELVRYLAEHDGRMPTDDLPLALWIVDVLDLDEGHPVRRVLEGIPAAQLSRNLPPKKAHAWYTWLLRYDCLVSINRRGQDLDEAMTKDKALRDWYNDQLSRQHIGSLGIVEALLLERNPLWDPDRLPDTKASRGQMAFKVGINAVREFYLEHKHTDIPEGHTVSGLDVHQWWHIQRNRYASDTGMKANLRQQFTRLGNLGVDLRTDKERAKVDAVFRYRDRLKEIADYIDRRGMDALPQKGEPFVNSAREWIAQYNNGTLDPALEVALEEIDGWSWGHEVDLEALREYALAWGHLDVKREHVAENGSAIGEELYQVRKEYWLKPYPEKSTKRLNRQFDGMACQGWERGISKLTAWCKRYDRMPEPDCVTRTGFRLGAFMRMAYRKAEHGLLTRGQLRDLSKATGKDWWGKADREGYARTESVLARFARAHGHCSPLWGEEWGNDGDKRDLSRFVVRVCADYEAGDLSPMEIRRLEGLPGWSWLRTERAEGRLRATGRKAAEGRAAAARKKAREPVRSVRTDVADPDSQLNRAGLRQFLPGD